MGDARAALRRSYLFRDAPAHWLDQVNDRSASRRVKRGGMVYRAGEIATACYCVIAGQLREVALTPRGQPSVFEIAGPGAILGEPALFTPGRRRPIAVEAMRESEVLAIPRDLLVGFLAANPEAMLRLVEGLAVQVVNAVDDVSTLAHLPIADRLAVRLSELCINRGGLPGSRVEIELDIDQWTLAHSIGASRENVNRALRAMAAAGVLRTGRSRLVVIDRGRLQALAAPWQHLPSRNALAADLLPAQIRLKREQSPGGAGRPAGSASRAARPG